MRSLGRGAALGAALGLAWGVMARTWMRAISDDPEFSWSGTLMIIGTATWLGLGVGLYVGARSAGRRPWWALPGLPGLLLFLSPGMVFLPSFALGGLAFRARRWWSRVVGLVAIVGPVAALGVLAGGVPTTADGQALFVVGGFLVLSVALAAGTAPCWHAAPTPRPRAVVSDQPSSEARSAPMVVSSP